MNAKYLLRALPFIFAIGFVSPSSVTAATADDAVLRKGDTVRGHYVSGESDNQVLPFDGIVAELDEEFLTLRGSPRRQGLVLARREITRMQVRTRSGSRASGAALGAFIGAGIGTAAGLASGDDENCFICFTAGDKALILTVLLAPTGALFGALFAPGSSWEWVHPGRMQLALASLRDGSPGVGLSVRF
jgi:hypothetical protein